VTLAVSWNAICGQVLRRRSVPAFQGASIAVDRKSMGDTVADRSSNEADFLCTSSTRPGGFGKVL
jgi:hypothetical protein